MNSVLSAFLGQFLLALLPIAKQLEAKYFPQIADLVVRTVKELEEMLVDLITGQETTAEEKLVLRIKLDKVKTFALSLLTQIEVDGERLPMAVLTAGEGAIGGVFGFLITLLGL